MKTRPVQGGVFNLRQCGTQTAGILSRNSFIEFPVSGVQTILRCSVSQSCVPFVNNGFTPIRSEHAVVSRIVGDQTFRDVYGSRGDWKAIYRFAHGS